MLAALSRSASLRLRAPPPPSSVLHARGVVARFSSSTPEGSATPNPAASDPRESKAEDASQDDAKGVAEEKGLSEVEQLSERIATLESEAEKKHDQLLRALAEADNSRRRAAIDVANSKKFAVEKFAKSLLEVADNLHRAAESVPEEARKSDEQPILASLYDGVTMTEAVLHKVFEQNGLIKMQPLGEKFDPNLHEALFDMVDPDKEPGTVTFVQTAGYLLNDRCLRAAQVGISKKPGE